MEFVATVFDLGPIRFIDEKFAVDWINKMAGRRGQNVSFVRKGAYVIEVIHVPKKGQKGDKLGEIRQVLSPSEAKKASEAAAAV